MPVKLTPTAALFAVVVALATVQPAAAQSTPPTTVQPAPALDIRRGWKGESADFDLSDRERSASPEAGTTGAGGNGRGASAAGVPVTFVVLGTLPDGSTCWQLRRGTSSEALVAAIKVDVQTILANLVVPAYPRCPSTGAPETTTPAVEAAAFWRVAGKDMLPKPSPRIAPGYMLAGKMAYLEAGSRPTARFEHPTPLGTLVIEATGRLYVDWGDSSGLDGPHVGPGGPWPDGNVTHYWTTTGRYDIRVVQRWAARWTLGAATGTVDGLETEGVIDDFEVRQLQAVINR